MMNLKIDNRVNTHTCLSLLVIGGLSLSGCASTSNFAVSAVHAQQVRFPIAALQNLEILAFDVYQAETQRMDAVVAAAATSNKKLQSIYYLYSEDGGQQWSVPQVISTGLPLSISSRGNDVQIASFAEQRVVLWQSAGDLPGMGPIVSAYSVDAGKTWQAGANPARNDAGDQARIDLAADQQGKFHAVWLEDPEEHGYQSLRYARSFDAGAHWEAAQTLDDSTCSCCWNTLTPGAQGELKVLYRNMQPRDMSLIQSTDHGVTWQTAGVVGDFQWQFDGCPHIGGGLAAITVNAKTWLHSIVWTGVEHKQGLYYLGSEDDGRHWSTPHLFSAQGLHGDIVAQTPEDVRAIWDERNAEGALIKFANSHDGGKHWSSALSLSTPGAVATHPRLLQSSTGTLAFWTEKSAKEPSRWAMAWIP